MIFDDLAFVTVRENDHRITFWFIFKNDAVDRARNANPKVDNCDDKKYIWGRQTKRRKKEDRKYQSNNVLQKIQENNE